MIMTSGIMNTLSTHLVERIYQSLQKYVIFAIKKVKDK